MLIMLIGIMKQSIYEAEKYDIFWFEEPVEPDDYIGQAEITKSTSIPVAAGEMNIQCS